MTIGSYLFDGDGAGVPGEGGLRSVDLFSPAPAPTPGPGLGVPSCPVAVVDADLTTRSRLAMQLGGMADPVPALDVLVPRLTGSPLVLVVGPSTSSDPRGVAALERLVQGRPEVGAIMLVGELSTEVLHQALRCGVKDVLAAPVDTAQLQAAVNRVAAGLSPSFAGGPGAGGAVEPEGVARVVTVFSTKGGSGKSMLASNLAVTLARRATGPVVLVDADLQFGDIAVMLKLAPQRTIVDAVGSIDRLDAPFLQSLLIRHEPSGLLVLPAPLEPAFADQIGASDMSRIIELLRSFCEYVVVDTPAYFNEVVLSLIEASDDVILVAGLDIPNIKNVKIGLQTLRLLNTPMEKLRLVLNRSNSKVKLDAGEVERTLQVKADGMIPSDVVVPQSVNKGVPVVLDAPKSGVAKAINALADQFAPPVESAKRRR